MKQASKWFLCVLSLACVLSAAWADWPGFRGPKRLGVSDAKDLPTKWTDEENIAWKKELPGPGASSPISFGDKIFITCYSGYGTGGDDNDQEKLKRHLVCLDQKKGDILWDKKIDAKLPETRYNSRAFIGLHGFASSTPVTDGKLVYVFFGKSGVFAFDFKGDQKWQADVGTGMHGWGCAPSPLLYKDLVIINAGVESGKLVALDKTSGDIKWKSEFSTRGSWSSPVLVDVKDKQEVVISLPHKLVGLNPENGKQLWTCEGIPDGYVCPTLVAKDGIIYVIGGRRNTAKAVKAGGTGDVTESHVVWTKRVGSNVSSPVISGDHLFWCHDGGGTFYCLALKDGDIKFQKRLQGSGRVYSSAFAADGKIYIVSRNSGTYVLEAKPEFKQLAQNNFGSDKSVCNGSPAVSKGRLLIRSNKYLYCIGKK